LAVGAAGGTRIYTAVLQTILGVVDYGLNISGSIESGRAHHTLYPNVADLDDVFPDDLVEGLTSRGHNVTRMLTGFLDLQEFVDLSSSISVHDINEITSSVQGITSGKNGVIFGEYGILGFQTPLIIIIAASDSRKNGVAAGL
jgi:gamma-glutamyltranspeptidase / glutathione hydrolase / leukotriene-C4 hydrolase